MRLRALLFGAAKGLVTLAATSDTLSALGNTRSGERSDLMFENEATLVKFCCEYLSKISGDISDADLSNETNGKTPRWILGHLRVVADMPRPMVGLESKLDETWVANYGPGSKPGGADGPSFELAQVVTETVGAYKELAEAARGADAEVMAQPHGLPILDGTALKTRGDLISHLLSTHFSFHLAQLSACRQAKGLGPLF